MELADLEIFRTVVEEGGIVKAARRLHRVQSNVTTRVRQLEESVGAQLFYRDRQRLHLSPSGELLLSYADRLLRLSDEAKSAVSGGTPTGVLRLGSLESTAAGRLPRVLSAFHAACPDVRVELLTGTNDALTQAVAQRRLDAAFVVETPGPGDLSAMPLFRERLVLIAARGHRPVRGPRDVAGESVITFPAGCAYRRALQRWLGERSLAGLRVLELSSYHAIVACVASGTGVALVPQSVLDTVQCGELERFALPRAVAQVTTPLVWRTREQSPPLAALVRLLAERRDLRADRGAQGAAESVGRGQSGARGGSRGRLSA